MSARSWSIWTRPAARVPVAQALFLLVLAVAVWLVYRPGLAGPYVFDDFQNISRNPPIAVQTLSWNNLLSAAFSKTEAGLGRPLAMVSFALNHYFAGPSFDPFAFKFTNLVIHGINAVLVFYLALGIFRIRAGGAPLRTSGVDDRRATLAAMFAASIWALHPLQLTSVLYTVQRMTSLSALFVFAGLLVYLRGRRRLAEGGPGALAWMAGGLTGGVLLGVLCKENALLLPLLAGTVELFVFSREALPPAARRRLRMFYLLFIGFPVLAAVLYMLLNPEFILRAYESRTFTPLERVLTQSRVLFFYVSLVFLPFLAKLGLYHDDFVLSTGLLSPPTTLIAILGWVIAGAALVAGFRRRAPWAFGLAWFLAGHAMESTVLGLEIIHEHRNYVPSFGLLFVIAHYLAALAAKLRFDPRTTTAGTLCILLVFGFVTHTRAQMWSSRQSLFEFLVRYHPGSYRALSGLAAAMREQGRDARAVYGTLRDAALANPSTVHPLVEMQKMIQVLIPASDRVANEVSVPDEGENPKLAWARDAVLERKYLLELDRAVAAEISRRILLPGTHIETVYALWTSQTCALNGRDYCLPLVDRLLEWHLLTLDRLPRGSKRKGVVQLSAAKLFALRGEIDQALNYVDRALETTSNHAKYRVQKAMLLIKLGDLDEAERIADEIEGEMDWRKTYSRDLVVLRREIDKARATAPEQGRTVVESGG